MFLHWNTRLQHLKSQFDYPYIEYESYQENGTKYLRSRKRLPEKLRTQLSTCAGEIFLCHIPPQVRAEQVAAIASQLGDLYQIRFKVTFSGDSRGIAYIQYLNPGLMQLAIACLPKMFQQNGLPMIRVYVSRNTSTLLLKKTSRISPLLVLDTLQKLFSFKEFNGREILPGYFEYKIVFKCNDEAMHALREITRTITTFGPNAVVVWDTAEESSSKAWQPTIFSVVPIMSLPQLGSAALNALMAPATAEATALSDIKKKSHFAFFFSQN